MKLSALALILALLHPAAGYRSVGDRSSVTPTPPAPDCTASQPTSTVPGAGPVIQGTSSNGQFLANTAETVPVKTDEKIVFRMTGTGPLHLDAIGPRGQVVTPFRLEAHGAHTSTWQGPGDEWGSLWEFPNPGCWEIRAARENVSGSLWLNVVGPRLRIDQIVLKQGGRRVNVLRANSPAVLVLRVTNPYTPEPAPHVVIWQAGHRYVAVTIRKPARVEGDTDLYRHSIRFSVGTSSTFKAIATVRVQSASDRRSLGFVVRP